MGGKQNLELLVNCTQIVPPPGLLVIVFTDHTERRILGFAKFCNSLLFGKLPRMGVPLGCDDRGVTQQVFCGKWIHPDGNNKRGSELTLC